MKQIVFVCCLLALVGCSGDGGRTIEGKVSFSDSSPLGRGAVILSNGKNSFTGGIDSAGGYKIENVLSGTYKVGISGAVTPGSGGKAGAEPGGYDAGLDDQGNYVGEQNVTPPVPLVKETLANPETSGLTLTVPGKYDITVERP